MSRTNRGIWILIGETFPTRTRARQASLATASNWLWNFLLAFFTPFIVKAIDYRYGFVFAACNLTGAIIVYLFLYESSDLSLEEVDAMYCDPNCTSWKSRTWAPEGFASRKDFVESKRMSEKRGPGGAHAAGGGKKGAAAKVEDVQVEHAQDAPTGSAAAAPPPAYSPNPASSAV